MAFASHITQPFSSSSTSHLSTSEHSCLSKYLHRRPLRLNCVRPRPSVLRIARGVAGSPSRHEFSPQALIHSQSHSASHSTGLKSLVQSLEDTLRSHAATPHSAHDPSLEILVQSLEETFRNSPSGELCKRWREYHGCNNWQGLLDPLDADLRAEILKYGDLVQLTYDAFDNEEHSQTRGESLYTEADLLEKAGLTCTGYTIKKYIYATSDVHLPKWLERRGLNGHQTNWMGYVAVATDEEEIARLGRRDIVVVWRGTVTHSEWLENVDGTLIDPVGITDECHVEPHDRVGIERGFYTLYTSSNEAAPHGHTSAAQQVREELARLVDLYKEDKNELSITMTGHSLGGALALLAAFDVASSNITTGVPISVISFAAPRLGNDCFRRRLEEVGVKVLRVVNVHDIVPKVPGIFVHETSPTLNASDHKGHTPSWNTYVHVGEELCLDNHHSPLLKKNVNAVDSHNLEVYLHLVDGYRSKQQSFIGLHGKFYQYSGHSMHQEHHVVDHQHENLQLCLKVLKRDVALVNKTTGILLDELHVLANWQAKKLPKPSVHLSTYSTKLAMVVDSHHIITELLHGLTSSTSMTTSLVT